LIIFLATSLVVVFVGALMGVVIDVPIVGPAEVGCLAVAFGILHAALRTHLRPTLVNGNVKLKHDERLGAASIESMYDRDGSRNAEWQRRYNWLCIEFGLVFSGTLLWGFGNLLEANKC